MTEESISSAECIEVLLRAGFRMAGVLNDDAVLQHRGVPVLVRVCGKLSIEEVTKILRSASLDWARFTELREETRRLKESGAMAPFSGVRLARAERATG